MILIEIVKNLWIAVSVVTCSMSVLKIQNQSPWGVLWKGVPKNYPNFIKKHLYQSLYRLEACNFTKKTPTRAYFRPLLHAVPAHNALTCTQCPVSIFADVFTLQKLGICMLFKAVSSLNLSFFIHTARMPFLSKISPTDTGIFWRTLQSFYEDLFCRTTTGSCFWKNYSLFCQ